MFKIKQFYRIVAIQRDHEYYGTNFWNAGYKYSYTPTSYAMKYIANIAEKYSDKVLKSQQIIYSVVKSVNEEEIVIKVVGRRQNIEKFITELCTNDVEFTKRFSMNLIPETYI